MLKQFPHEVIVHVCDYLSLRVKLNLVMTCRAFYEKLYKSKVFEDLEILSRNREAVMKLFGDGIIDYSSVKTLHIISPTEQDFTFYEMLPLFPKAQEFFIDNTADSTITPIPAETLHSLSYLKDTIQKYDNLHGFPVIAQLLKVYTFPRLTSLCLEGSPIDETNNPLAWLTNAPNLISLELNSCTISIGFLEQLHDKCRRLQSLKLGRGNLNLMPQALPEMIDPADELISFTSTLAVIRDTQCNFFHYIITKYPNLKIFDMNNWLDMPERDPDFVFGPGTASTTSVAYRRNLPALMMELLPRLTALKIEPYLVDNFFDTIITNQTQLASLCAYDNTNRFDFFKYSFKIHTFLATLKHLSSLTVEITLSNHLYSQNYRHPNIKELHLLQSHTFTKMPKLKLDEIFFTYNGLRTFLFECPHVNLTLGNIYDTIQYPNLQHLTINASMSTDDTLKYINQCLPNVTDLSCRNSSTDSQSYEVNLPNHSLNLLNFHCVPLYDVPVDVPVFTFLIQKESISKTVEVFKVEQNHIVKEKMGVDQEVDENRQRSTFINITCRDIRELHCGDIIIF